MSRLRNVRGKANTNYADYEIEAENGTHDLKSIHLYNELHFIHVYVVDVSYDRAVADELEGSDDDEFRSNQSFISLII